MEEFTAGLSYQDFCGDRKTFDAVARNLEIIGEASKKLPDDIRAKYPAVQWKKMASLRDILAHEYFRVNSEILWDIVKSKLPELKSGLRGGLSGE